MNIMPIIKASKTLSLVLLGAAASAVLAASGCVETEDVAPAAKSFTPDPNAMYTVISVQSGKCVEVTEGEPHALQIRNCATSPRHRFKIAAAGGGFYKLRNVETDLCVDIDGQSRADGARLMARPCGDAASSGRCPRWVRGCSR